MKRYLVLILSFLISFVYSYGQNISYFGKISDTENSGALSGVTVSAISDGTTVTSSTTSSDGKYSLQFVPGKNYTIEYSKPGYVTKIIKIETKDVNPEDMPPGGKIFPPIDMDLFKKIEGVDFSFLNTEPVVTWYFDKAGMNFDRKQVTRVKKKIDDKIAEADGLAEKQEAKYNSLIQEADLLFKGEKYQEALDKYTAALQIPGKQTEEYPSKQIVKIGDILQNLEEKELAAKQGNQEYSNFVTAADNLFKNKQYDKAIETYNKALGVKPDEQYPKDKIAEVQEAIGNASKQEEFDKVIKSADMFFKQNSLQAARDKYIEASKLLPNEAYPKQQLDKIKEQLEAKSEQLENQKKYNDAVEVADALFDKEQYEQSIAKYNEAISYESASTYPRERIKLAEEKLTAQNAQKEKEEQFKRLVEDGDTQLNLKNYEDAIGKYNQALALIEDEAITKKRDETQILFNKLKENEEQTNQIASLLKSAQEKLENKDYQGAVDDYTSVLELNVQNPDAIKGKKEAERLLANLQDIEAQEAQFNQLVADADAAFDAKKWEDAKLKYIAAKGLFADRSHVNDRIEEIRLILLKQENAEHLAADIQVLLDQAEKLKLDNSWASVIEKYEEALKLDDQRGDVSALLEAAKKSKNEWDAKQSVEEQFASLKHDGEVLMAQKNWTEAKSKFEAALAIRDDKAVQKNIEIIENEIASAQQSQESEQAYADKMSKAEGYASSLDYEDAITTFQEALKIKKNDPTAVSRIKDMQQKIDQLKVQKEKDERYESAMKDGKEASNNEDYAAAIKFYDDALIEKPLDSEATRLKMEAKNKISNLQSEEEVYQGLLSKGQKEYDDGLARNNDIPSLQEAKKYYMEAQEMRPKASLPQNKIVEIDQLLRQIAEESSEDVVKEREYQNKLDLASVAAQNSKYQNAINYLQEASEIKPNEELPKQKIKEYQDLLERIAAQNELDKKYANTISQADLAFDQKNYEESIDLYNEALVIKETEEYPKSQIRKAKKSIENLNTSTLNQDYNRYIIAADKHFSDEDYEDAIDSYKEALKVKAEDPYAKQKINEAEQLLIYKKEQEALNSAQLNEYNKHIEIADAFYKKEEYLEAKEEYENGLRILPNDVYANEQVRLCVYKAKEKSKEGDEERYQKILSVADKYFDDENYDKAIGLYERAIGFRSHDQYPKDRLAEINSILSGDAKMGGNIEDLGEKVDISIMEGEALLEAGAKQREYLKLEAIENQLKKNEGNAEDRLDKDYEERVKYQNEVVAITDLKDENFVDQKEQHQVFIEHVNDIEYNWEKQGTQLKNYEDGDMNRTYRNIVYIDDAMDEVKRQKKDNHDDIVERIEIIKKDRDNQSNAEAARYESNIDAISDELLKVKKQNETKAELNIEKQENLQIKVDDIIRGREVQTHQEENDNYAKVMLLENDATLAEIKDSESKNDKLAIQKQLQEDIKVLAASLQRKDEQQSDEVYVAQLEVDAQLARVNDNYEETKTKKDEDRQRIVEKVKDIEKDQLKQSDLRSQEHYQTTQNNLKVVGKVEKMQEEQTLKSIKDLEAIDEGVKAREQEMERNNDLRAQQEKNDHQYTENKLDRIRKQYALTEKGKDEQTKQNYEDVKGLEASVDKNELERQKQSKDSKMEMQDLVNKLENNTIAFSPKIANTIGDEFPEGVSQENYVRKDKDGIPVRIVTRRFVVSEGHGDIYIRIQSRNGITYSKNGEPITEESWIRGTEDAKLVKNY